MPRKPPLRTELPRDIYIAVERRRPPPRPWHWALRSGERILAQASQGYAGAEEAWEAAQRALREQKETLARPAEAPAQPVPG